jgi:hypothetical protein
MRDDYHYNWSAGEKILTKIRKSVTASLRKARKKTKAESKAA